MEIPSTPWREGEPWAWQDAHPYFPAGGNWQMQNGIVRHTFTHFHLELSVAKGSLTHHADLGQWCPIPLLSAQGLPTVMKKIVTLVAAFRANQPIP